MPQRETIKQMVEAIKKYLEGFKQVLNAARQIPDIDSTHKAIDVADGFRSGHKDMKEAREEYDKSEKGYDKQLGDLDKKVTMSSSAYAAVTTRWPTPRSLPTPGRVTTRRASPRTASCATSDQTETFRHTAATRRNTQTFWSRPGGRTLKGD